MKRVIVVVVLFVVGGTSQLTSISPAPTFRDSYTMAIDGWEKSENISISPMAQDVIVSSFRRYDGLLADLGGDRRWKDSDRTLKQTLVIYYLSDLRDMKVGANSQTHPTPMQMEEKVGASQREPGNTNRMAYAGVESSDVAAYPVDKFFTKITPILKDPKGELHVISKPTGAAITLDNTKRGNTEKITVESAGDHQIIVSSKKDSVRCQEKITIPSGGSITFHCP
jgi:hypothetical protein